MPRAHYHQTPRDLDLYMFIKKIDIDIKDMLNVKFQLEVEHWASRNDLEDHKIYEIIIKMLVPKFMNNL